MGHIKDIKFYSRCLSGAFVKKLFNRKIVKHLPLSWYRIHGKWTNIVTVGDKTYIDGKLAKRIISRANVKGVGDIVWPMVSTG